MSFNTVSYILLALSSKKTGRDLRKTLETPVNTAA